ncbi:MAG: M48 family metallopeptidase [Actinomycetota bacterium]|nr:M48 family metallopeptidase [Actinomycetota bacterium]
MNRGLVVTALAALVFALLALLATTVPWDVLPHSAPRVDLLHDFSAAEVARERAFHRALRPSAYGSLALGLLVAAVLGLTPWGGRIVVAAGRLLGGGWVAQVVAGSVALAVVGRLATAALDARSETVLREYGLSNQSWAAWAADLLKGLGITAGVTALVLLAVLGLARWLPQGWWVAAAAVVAGFVVVASFAYPLVVEPVFNRFRPLPQGQLRTDLLALAARDGVHVNDVLVADASRRTAALNAYVSGFGSTRRIVVYDTLLATASPQEVELVVAHELGHAKRNDVLRGTAWGAIGGAAAVCLLALLLSWPALLDRAGATGPSDPRVLALLLFLVAAGGLLVQPASSLVSRRIEARADVHAMELTCDVATFTSSQHRLAVSNLSDLDPSPLVYAVFFTHPTSPQRIALAREYARLHC